MDLTLLSRLASEKRRPDPWIGGAGGAATTNRKREHPQKLTLVDAVEALTRTTRLGFLPEKDFAQAIRKFLHEHGHGSPTSAYKQEQAPAKQNTATSNAQMWNPAPTGDKPWQQTTRKVWDASTYTQKQHQQKQQTVQAFITSEWQTQPILTTPRLALQALQDGVKLPGNLVEVNAVEADEIADAYQAFAPVDQPLTMFWQGSTAEPDDLCQRVRIQLKGSNQFLPQQLVFRALAPLGCPLPKPAQKATVPTN